MERYSFLQYSGCIGLSEFGSLTSESVVFKDASISGVRRRIQTGLPRHSTVIISPGPNLLISASTGAPAALARSDGVRLATNGTAVATAAAPPATVVRRNSPPLEVQGGFCEKQSAWKSLGGGNAVKWLKV